MNDLKDWDSECLISLSSNSVPDNQAKFFANLGVMRFKDEPSTQYPLMHIYALYNDEVRGECYMTKSHLLELVKALDDKTPHFSMTVDDQITIRFNRSLCGGRIQSIFKHNFRHFISKFHIYESELKKLSEQRNTIECILQRLEEEVEDYEPLLPEQVDNANRMNAELFPFQRMMRRRRRAGSPPPSPPDLSSC